MLEQDIRTLLTQAGLPIPPLPRQLLPKLNEHDNLMLSTQPLISSPYDLPQYLTELSAIDDDFFALGQAGYGINNWVFYYYLKWNKCTLAIQIPWGGALLEPNLAKKQLEARFSILKDILSQVHKKHLAFAAQLIVIDSTLYPQGWGWQHSDSAPTWYEDNLPVLEQVQQALTQSF
ncbi:hypothetical protein [Shewanella surugensis]|uniref:Uncharacterized protein n=1 Tax=Shewanella surugensis TaxID=212020 RepID=A0ABT0LHM4_9GAMM|nr:hypothetical protein [Shewanella surugensis]MCL1127208.1 hypothetical protein [Shewanella surugensis]